MLRGITKKHQSPTFHYHPRYYKDKKTGTSPPETIGDGVFSENYLKRRMENDEDNIDFGSINFKSIRNRSKYSRKRPLPFVLIFIMMVVVIACAYIMMKLIVETAP